MSSIKKIDMKKTCKDCKARFDVPIADYEEGDAITCPECNLEYTIIADEKDPAKLTLIESKKLEMAEEEDDFTLEDEDYDYD
jgi:DNA-directed RNA polymerase subunit RPC12/RpoP